MAEQSDVRPGEVAHRAASLLRRRRLFHRPHPHAVQVARRVPEEYGRSRTPSAGSSSIRAMPPGLEDLGLYSHVWLLYWMDQARRDLIQQVPAHLGRPRGTFALRSPVRPNPIALAAVELLGIDGTTLTRAQRRLHRRHAAARHQALFRLHRQLSDARRP